MDQLISFFAIALIIVIVPGPDFFVDAITRFQEQQKTE